MDSPFSRGPVGLSYQQEHEEDFFSGSPINNISLPAHNINVAIISLIGIFFSEYIKRFVVRSLSEYLYDTTRFCQVFLWKLTIRI